MKHRHLSLSFALAIFGLPVLADNISVNWLDKTPPLVSQGVSWGVPWPRGAMKTGTAFSLTDGQGKALPVQSWPMAYWPDGSLKWSGFATIAGPDAAGPLTLSSGAASTAPAGLKVTQTADAIVVDTGLFQARISKQGANLIDSITMADRVIAQDGRLECILQNGPELDPINLPPREKFFSLIKKVTVEQSGPVRAVVKFEGMHKSEKGTREWLPFYVRLYFYAGDEPIRLVHTIIFDGDQEKDFIRGLGVRFTIPMREQIQNRHVRFSGEGSGLWSEPIQPLIGRGGRFVSNPAGGGDVYPTQLLGRRVPNREQLNPNGQNLYDMWAVWDDFKLIQPNADGFSIVKRTNPKSTWLPAGAGKRASGLVFAGDVSGGLAVGIKNFWQSHPASLEVQNASSPAASLVAWLWSPDAPSMDMRHYDIKPHGLEEVYEDVQEGFSTATGVARTSELTLYPTAEVPTKETTVAFAQSSSKPPLLVCTPQYLQSAKAFGIWGVEDRSTPVRVAIEDRLATTLNYYLTQPEDRSWYGFWDFGDVMHSYDNARHVWRYDLGGMAWDNSELGTDMWLWYSFLRTGRADVFRMAEAMTRHTGEVDCYHLGRFEGLGSRHNVRHWGCGAKEARISQAAYRRFHFYLTTDERTGDVMREMLNSDFKTIEFDPMRLARPIKPAEKAIAPTRVRVGPDWIAFAGNWMTEWERTGDTKWRDKIMAGVESMSAMPLGIRTGGELVMGYDPATGKLYKLNEDAGTYNLSTIMGGAEVGFELGLMLDDPRWHKLWDQYCRLYSAPKAVVLQDAVSGSEGMNANYVRDGRLAGYLYTKTQNTAFRDYAVGTLTGTRGGRGGAAGGRGGGARGGRGVRTVQGPESLNPVEEGPSDTNNAAQNSLETISMLGTVGEFLPKE